MMMLPETAPPLAAAPRRFTSRDGRSLQLRRVARDDTAMLAELLLRLSAQTRRFRYFTFRTMSLAEAWREAERIARGDAGEQIAVVATAPRAGGEEAVAVAELVPDAERPSVGHLAVLVRDDRQRQGIGTAVMRQLLALARASGVATVRADLLAENHAARRLLDTLDLGHSVQTRWGEMAVSASLAAPAGGPLLAHAPLEE